VKRIALLLVVIMACKDGSKDAPPPAAEPASPGAAQRPTAPRPDLAGTDSGSGSVDRNARRHERAQAMHDRLDKNGDGKLTPDELANAEPEPGHRAMRFDDPAAIDTNHDGDISVDELEAAMQARRDKMRAMWRGRHGSDGSDSGTSSGGSDN
jgi:hypothetical protein